MTISFESSTLEKMRLPNTTLNPVGNSVFEIGRSPDLEHLFLRLPRSIPVTCIRNIIDENIELITVAGPCRLLPVFPFQPKYYY